MAEISLSNSAGRDAVVSMDSVSAPLRVRWLDPNGTRFDQRAIRQVDDRS